MAFLRAKSVGDRVYLYLVENRWDAAAGYPRQRVLLYLGPLEGVRAEALPAPHRTPRMEQRLARLQASLRARRAPAEAASVEELLGALLAGDPVAARTAARRVVRSGGLDEFYGRTLPEVFRRIGEGWRAGRISIAREHVATAVAGQVIEGLNAALPDAPPGSPEVILCVPDGEPHTLPLALAEGLLRRGGFRPINLGGTAPNGDIVTFVAERRPKMVWISITQPSRLGSARTLAARLKIECPEVRVVLGGRGVPASAEPAHRGGAELVRASLVEFMAGLGPARPLRPARTRSASRSPARRAVASRAP